MKVVRKITYESDSIEALCRQLKVSLVDGSFKPVSNLQITIETLEPIKDLRFKTALAYNPRNWAPAGAEECGEK